MIENETSERTRKRRPSDVCMKHFYALRQENICNERTKCRFCILQRARNASRIKLRDMSQSTHTGSCHCGAIRYQATLDLEQPVLACNCSICGRSGTLLSFIPASQFVLESGADALTDYQFNKHAIHHNFCKTCGIKSFARGKRPDGTPTVAVNVRCLDGVELGELTITQFDGRSR
jgi:hypothetical protein